VASGELARPQGYDIRRDVPPGAAACVSQPGEQRQPPASGDGPYLDTDHLGEDLGQRAVSGGVVTTAAQAAKFLLNLVAVAVLARLLAPQEFGLVAMVSAITGFLVMLKDAGLSTATVQRASVTHRQISNLFWINVGLGGAAGLASLALAPAVAWFYGDARLVGIMAALSLTFLLTGLTVQHNALLVRQMRFALLAMIELGSMLAGIAVATGLALAGWGYWALVGMQLVAAGAGLVLTWLACRWRPSLPSRNSGVRPLLTFGVHMTLASVVSRLAWDADKILIGRFHGADALGLYSRAHVLLVRPLEQLLSPVSAVLVPALSRLQSDPERYRRAFLRVYDTLAVLTFSLTALLLALSRPLILTLLGPAWDGAVPLFAGFTVAALYMPLAWAASWLLTTQGRGRDYLLVYTLLSPFTLAAYVVGLPFGPLGVVLAFSACALLICLPVTFHVAGRSGPVRSADLWRGFLSNLPCWVAVYGATSLASAAVAPVAPLTELLICGPVGLAVALGALLVLDGPRTTALYSLTMLRSRFARP
jgi:O-antigen/teichoic acid export membrane protein